MLRRYLIGAAVVVLLVLAIVLALRSEQTEVGSRVATAPDTTASDFDVNDVEPIVGANNEFAFDLYARLKDHEETTKAGGNLFFSPYSISTGLAMTWAGARGETERQMAEVLHFGLDQDPVHQAFAAMERRLDACAGCELNIANALWGQKGDPFREEFLNLLKRNYGADLKRVDFFRQLEEARRTINQWVQERTKGRIRELVQRGVLDPDLTSLVLANAIYFKGAWQGRFDRAKTRAITFTVAGEHKVRVPMMYQKSQFRFLKGEDLKVLELPYLGGELSMVLFLPKAVDGISQLEESLTARNLTAWLGKLRTHEVSVDLPRFKIGWGTYDLKDTLKAMGMRDAFSLPPADFSGITGERDSWIEYVLHKAFVEVNEEGTEAAAATVVPVYRNGGPTFRADHPFAFVIRDNVTGSILFLGRVMNPAIQN